MKQLGRMLVVLLLLAVGVVVVLRAQQFQSGGSGSNASVGSTGATAPTSATLSGGSFNTTLPTLTNGQMGALQFDSSGRLLVGSIASALPAGGNAIGSISNTGFNVTGSLPSGTNVIGVVNMIPKTACGNTVASQALAALPTTATVVFSSTTCVTSLFLSNTNSTALTVTVTDNQATPINAVLTFSIPGNSQNLYSLGGVAFTTGLKWNASATGATGGILGYQ